jgi:two-component SAPR family response regulator
LSTPRIYLTGQVLIEYGDHVVTERDLPGRQVRLAFVFLMANRSRPINRGELVDVLWPDEPPQDTETALSAILSKLRAALKKTGGTIDTHSRCIGIRLPSETWIDVEEAANAIDIPNVMSSFVDSFRVEVAKLGDDATILGSAAWAQKKVGEFSESSSAS